MLGDVISNYVFRLSPQGVEWLEDALIARAEQTRAAVMALPLPSEQREVIESELIAIEEEAAGSKKRTKMLDALTRTMQFATDVGSTVTAAVIVKAMGL